MALPIKPLFAAAALLVSSAAAAADSFIVETNKTEPLRLRTRAASVVIGNPTIADVSVLEDRVLLITGRQFGTTNLIVFDALGRQTYSADVVVTPASDNLVTINRAGDQATLDCAEGCRELQQAGQQ